eukprot:CAMPEP_0197435970 /NCGR_PEP_ID=MMETSP1175-20131217/3452_1 /TAXON_ID=1003142 /ORGANISM="Triceratium dubium, Strain CCMP147" /LENGTH=890 /DNA_ID=CAMNT_0042965125 /DNA_START=170 /DNA_END=2842 /DNA_ORIENTATION=+
MNETVVNDEVVGQDSVKNVEIKVKDAGDSDPVKLENGEGRAKSISEKKVENTNTRRLTKLSIKESFKKASDEYPLRETSIPVCGGSLIFNSFTSIFGIAILWGFSIWCMVQPEKALETMVSFKAQCTQFFTWFFIGTKPIFIFFVIFLAFRYGNVKLGHPEDQPDFSNILYFCMLFSSGIENSLFFYGVAEPLYHQSTNWHNNAGYRTQDEIDQFAINQTLFHWGLAGWGQYLLVAICVGLASFKYGLPFTYRSCFFPLLGNYTWGWIGDIIEGFAIVTTIAGTCTSLGLGILQIVSGLERLGTIESEDATRNAVITIWIITVVSTASLLSGLNVGIKYLSQIGFALGMLILFLVLVMDKTNYIFNLFVQSTGYYLQYSVVLLNFWTDAFGQLEDGQGRALDGESAESWWMDAWTVFYWAWWTAWSGFVGMFVARISKGRTIREIVFYGFGAAILYTFLWFCVFGGVGIRQSRQAFEMEQLGAVYFNNSDEFLADGSTYCYNVPQQDVIVNGTTVFTNSLLGVTPVCKFNEDDAGQAWFNVMYSFSFPENSGNFGGFGAFLTALTIGAIMIYFVTSSDSASLMVDHMSSNGREENHQLQRLFWSLTEGAVCTALIVAGQSNALLALQSAAVIAGLPFTLFLCYQVQTTWIMCSLAGKAEDPSNKLVSPRALLDEHITHTFDMPVYGGIFNLFEYIVSLGGVHKERVIRGMDLPSKFQAVEFFKGLFLPFLSLHRILFKLHPERKCYNLAVTMAYAFFFVAWIVLFCWVAVNPGFVALGWSAFFADAVILTSVRIEVRSLFELSGNVLEDFGAASFFYPQGLVQMLDHFENNQQPTKLMSSIQTKDGDDFFNDEKINSAEKGDRVVPANFSWKASGEKGVHTSVSSQILQV